MMDSQIAKNVGLTPGTGKIRLRFTFIASC